MRIELKTITNLPTIEILALINDIKPSVLFAATNEEIDCLKSIFPSLFIKEGKSITNSYLANEQSWFAVSKKKKITDELLISFDNCDVEKVGRLLGYPKCCTHFFLEIGDKIRSRELICLIKNRSGGTKPYSFYTNNLYNFFSRLSDKYISEFNQFWNLNNNLNLFQNLHIISHVPCSYRCKDSLLLGRKLYKLLYNNYRKKATKIKALLNKTVIFFDIFKTIVLEARVVNDTIHYKKVLPPYSFLNDELLSISKGNKIIIKNDEIKIYRGSLLLGKYRRKDDMDGIILNFKSTS